MMDNGLIQLDDFDLDQFGWGIVYVHLSVSGPSAKCWRLLNEAHSTSEKLMQIPIVQVNGLAIKNEGDIFTTYMDSSYHGVGETFWVNEGQFINWTRFSLRYSQVVIEHSEQLLQLRAAM